jgi:hypothetical protein
MTLNEITHENIKNITPEQLTKLLHSLLKHECTKYKIPLESIHVPRNITVGDGGEDGRVKWENHVEKTNFIPNRYTVFQNKAVKAFSSQDCVNEIIDKEDQVKSQVRDVLLNGGSYVLFITLELNQKQKDQRIQAMGNALNKKNLYDKSCNIKIYSASEIATWVNEFPSIVFQVKGWCRESIPEGIKTYDQWGKSIDKNDDYVDFLDRNGVSTVDKIKNYLNQSQQAIRIIGNSGLGKTRMVYQIFQELEEKQSFVIYIDFESMEEKTIKSHILDWIENYEILLIVDNCSHTLCNYIMKQVRRENRKFRFISIDYRFEKVNECIKCYELDPWNDSDILKLLNSLNKEKNYTERHAKFCQGYPDLAKQIDNLDLNEKNLSDIATDEFIAMVLFQKKDINSDEKKYKILQICSLFSTFVWDDKNIYLQYFSQYLEYDIDYIFKTVRESKSIKFGGSLGQVRPLPIAMSLINSWISHTTDSTKSDFIKDMPDDMISSFCERIKFLGDTVASRKFVSSIKNGLLNDNEFLFSEKGSALFYALVHISSRDMCDHLYVKFKTLSSDDIRFINIQARDNFSRSLNVLFYHNECFDHAAELLLKLIIHSEKFNYLYDFKNLFQVVLANTSVDYTTRVEFLKRIIRLQNKDADKVIMRSILDSFDDRHATANVGAEYQGSKEYERYVYKNEEEVLSYYIELLAILYTLISQNYYTQNIKDTLACRIRSLISFDRLHEYLDKCVLKIIENTESDYWVSLSRSIDCIKKNGQSYSDKTIELLQSWQDHISCNCDDIKRQLISKVIEPDDNGSDLTQEIEELVFYLRDNSINLLPYLSLLMSDEKCNYTEKFSKKLIIELNDFQYILNYTIKYIKEDRSKKRDFPFFNGIMEGLYEKDQKKWNEILNIFEVDRKLQGYFPNIVKMKPTYSNIKKFLTLVENKQLNLDDFFTLYSFGGNYLLCSEIVELYEKVKQINIDKRYLCFRFFYLYVQNKKDYDRAIINPILKDLALFRYDYFSEINKINWYYLVQRLLKEENVTFAIDLCQELLSSDSYVDQYQCDIFYKAFELYGNKIWDNVSINILKLRDNYKIKKLYSNYYAHGSSNVRTIFPLLEQEKIVDWCQDINALELVAQAMPIFEGENSSKKVNPLLICLLREYGDNNTFI